jgi:hypothetical protein
VLALDSPSARASVAKACAAARDADRCDVLVLGCAGMSGLAAELTGELGTPVVDGVAVAVKIVEALVALGLHSFRTEAGGPQDRARGEQVAGPGGGPVHRHLGQHLSRLTCRSHHPAAADRPR